eukprot:8796753-Pyramimonas_sp.AAC.1
MSIPRNSCHGWGGTMTIDRHGQIGEAGSHMEGLPTDDTMEKVIAAIEKGTTMLFTAQSRKKVAP